MDINYRRRCGTGQLDAKGYVTTKPAVLRIREIVQCRLTCYQRAIPSAARLCEVVSAVAHSGLLVFRVVQVAPAGPMMLRLCIVKVESVIRPMPRKWERT